MTDTTKPPGQPHEQPTEQQQQKVVEAPRTKTLQYPVVPKAPPVKTDPPAT